MIPGAPAPALPEPPAELRALSERLTGRIRADLGPEGSLSFAEYMERVLYEPGLGYYSAGLQKFGAEGDFVTAPELGQVFGRSIALQCEEIGQRLGAGGTEPAEQGWDLLEIGAGSGALAATLLERLSRCAVPLHRYRILERSADLRAVQRRRLAALDLPPTVTVTWLDAPPEEPWQGVLVANEVLDALPAERFHWDGQGLSQLRVRWHEDRFTWSDGPAPPFLEHAVRQALGEHLAELPSGYTSEIQPRLADWLSAVTDGLQRGVALLVDYGYPRGEYYHPQRRDGTLVCHYRHRAHGDPFWWPGLQDLSVFVDFSAVAEAGSRNGLELLGYAGQGEFLTALGLERVTDDLSTLPDRERWALAREIRELVLPGAMGEKFQVMALGRGLTSRAAHSKTAPDGDDVLSGFRGAGLARRL